MNRRIEQSETGQLGIPEMLAMLVISSLVGGFTLAFIEELIKQAREEKKRKK